MPSSVVLTDASSLALEVVVAISRSRPSSSRFDDSSLLKVLEDTAVVTNSASLAGEIPSIPPASASYVVSLASDPSHHTAERVALLASILEPGGTLVLQQPVVARAAVSPEESQLLASLPLLSRDQLQRSLLLGGLASWEVVAPVSEPQLAPGVAGVTSAAVGSVHGPLVVPLALKASKPQWRTGSSFKLRLRSSAASASSAQQPSQPGPVPPASSSASQAAPALPPPSAWSIPAGAAAAAAVEADEDLIDEDSLLGPEDMAAAPPPPVAPAAGGCAPTARKACKNCTCGRAEREAAEEAAGGTQGSQKDGAASTKLSLDQIANPQSACGSCGLGDAFRCAGCPYRGLPPFKLGEKISLDTNLLAADV